MDLEINYYFQDLSFYPIGCNKYCTIKDFLEQIKKKKNMKEDDLFVMINGHIALDFEKLEEYVDDLHFNALFITDEPAQELTISKISFNINDYKDILKSKYHFSSFQAVDKKTNTPVFIKFFPNNPESAFFNMARGIYIMLLMNFSGIQKVLGYQFSVEKDILNRFEISRNQKDIILITEFMKNGSVGENVKSYLKNPTDPSTIMNPTVRSKIIFGVAAILKKLHKNKIIHRHLSIKGVLLDENGEPIISDFQFATFMSDKERRFDYSNDFFYTRYEILPPEVFGDYYDSSVIKSAIDVFSFGMFIYRMFSCDIIDLDDKKGKPRSHQQYIMRIAKGARPVRTKNIPDHYWELIQYCWNQNPLDRPSFNEITKILKDDKFALEEFGMKTDLEKLHEYQKRIDSDDEIESLKAEIAKLKEKINSIENNQPQNDISSQFTLLDSNDMNSLRIIRDINSGGGGRVIEVGKETSYALKQMHISNGNIEVKNVKKFMNEYELLYRMNHPNIVHSFGFFIGDEKNPPSILLEFCPFDMNSVIKKKDSKKDQIVIWVYQIVESMKYVHKCKIIHRDLKPSNILIGKDGLIRVTDFGISKLMTLEEQSTTLGEGTQKFMAPELLNEEEYNEKVDVYSFGVVLYFMLSGGEMPKINIIQMGNGKKAPIPDSFTPLAKEIIDKCWNRKPDDRPSFEKLLQLLDENDYKILDLTETQIKNVKAFVQNHKNLIP